MSKQQAKSSAGPTQGSERIVALDVLRGFALLGILIMNIQSFAMPSAAYTNPTAYGDLQGSNLLVWFWSHVLADQKFMALFSMLFGAGVVLMADRAAASSRSPAGIHYRRMVWLGVFGLAHAHFLWYGDILFWYSLSGMVVFLWRGKSPLWLLSAALVMLLIPSLLMVLGGLSMSLWPAELKAEAAQIWLPSAESIARELLAYRDSYWGQMPQRSSQALGLETYVVVSFAFWRCSGLMLMGMALFKLGVLSGARSKKEYAQLLALSLLVGLSLVLIGVHLHFEAGWSLEYSFLFGMQWNYWGAIGVSLAWTALVMLACQSLPAGCLRPLAAVGQTALSNYLLQSIVCTWIFYGHGLGLYGTVERSGQLALVPVIWVFQILASMLWLRSFRMGPFEWLWRSLIYRQPQPWRRQKAKSGTDGA